MSIPLPAGFIEKDWNHCLLPQRQTTLPQFRLRDERVLNDR